MINIRKNIVPVAFVLILLVGLSACTGANTFPMIARAGDTVSVMVGGSEQVRKDTIDVTLKDINGQTWDLKALGLVRSVFNLRMDGRAIGLNYSSQIDTDISWIMGHEPVQTVLVVDLPLDVAPGAARLVISKNVNDNSSGIGDPFPVWFEVIPGAGNSDEFLRKNASGSTSPADLAKLEPAPHAKIRFNSGDTIGAVSLKIGFDNLVLNGDDINIYSPESTVRLSGGKFGATQRMVYWRQDGQDLYIDIVAPQGVNGKYLQLFVMHPKGLSGTPNFVITDTKVYDVDGNLTYLQPSMQYFP